MDERLHEAVLKGDVSAFLVLVQEDEDILKQVVPRSSSTILHLAARLGHHELAAEILKLSPELAATRNEKLDTPLHEACREGRAEIVKLLLETDPLIAGKVNRDNETALYVGCDRGRLDVVKQLLNHPWLLALELDGFTTSLHLAASRGHTDIVKEILKVRPDFAREKDLDGCTPLHLACSKGHLEVTSELLRLDPDLTSLQDKDGLTPLHWAIIKGHLNIIDKILAIGLHLAQTTTKHGETVLHLGVKNNRYEAVQYLMEKLNFTQLLNTPDKNGNTILHVAAAGKLTTMVKYLLELGVDVNAQNCKGFTSLDVITSDASNSKTGLEIVTALCQAGAKRCSQLSPASPEIQENHQPTSGVLNSLNVASPWPKMMPDSPVQHHNNKHDQSRKKLLDQNEGLRNARNKFTVVAVLVATVTFSAGINPPGGFNQETGKSMLGKQTPFKVFMVCNILALFLSLSIVIVLVSVIPYRRTSMMRLLVFTHKVMWVSMIFMAAAYMAATWMIIPPGPGSRWEFAVLLCLGGGCTMAIFLSTGMVLVRQFRKYQLRKVNVKMYGGPDNIIGHAGEMQMIKRHGYESTCNSDVDSSDQGGYHLY
ncbi:ankyrin repeat-containing protein NPR4-like [Vitis riparia]|uniref:ankyrin repeat-containing protein NPR4-like n=1 Tax=Vitis riparia TaxID=96939 RepID=UPI00155AAD6B|nr:ankyrin repeat-containing protein NPR4-like [Vitis riparia]